MIVDILIHAEYQGIYFKKFLQGRASIQINLLEAHLPAFKISGLDFPMYHQGNLAVPAVSLNSFKKIGDLVFRPFQYLNESMEFFLVRLTFNIGQATGDTVVAIIISGLPQYFIDLFLLHGLVCNTHINQAIHALNFKLLQIKQKPVKCRFFLV